MPRYVKPKPAAILAAALAQENGGFDLGGASPYKAAKDAEALCRLGNRAVAIATRRCNGVDRYDAKAGRVLASWTENDDKRADKAEARIMAEASKILDDYNAAHAVKVGGDPRGFCLTFKLASGCSNGADDKRWGV